FLLLSLLLLTSSSSRARGGRRRKRAGLERFTSTTFVGMVTQADSIVASSISTAGWMGAISLQNRSSSLFIFRFDRHRGISRDTLESGVAHTLSIHCYSLSTALHGACWYFTVVSSVSILTSTSSSSHTFSLPIAIPLTGEIGGMRVENEDEWLR
ncbi:hypothetical protein PFISCL1PPCAC_10884, partial [Pristionchus fissidentatus]